MMPAVYTAPCLVGFAVCYGLMWCCYVGGHCKRASMQGKQLVSSSIY